MVVPAIPAPGTRDAACRAPGDCLVGAHDTMARLGLKPGKLSRPPKG